MRLGIDLLLSRRRFLSASAVCLAAGWARADRLSDAGSVQPEDYGAVPDGVADCTAALTAAIRSGRAVVLSAGSYRVTAPIVVRLKGGAFNLTGAGPGKSKIILDHFDAGLDIQGAPNSKLQVSLSRISVIRSRPDTYQGKPGPKAIYVAHADQVDILDIEEAGGIGFGVQVDQCSRYRIMGCYVHDHASGAVHRSGMDGIHVYRCPGPGVVSGNRIARVGDDAISFGSYQAMLPTTDFICRDNNVENVAGSIKMYGAVSRGLIENNVVKRGFNGGVTLWDDRDGDASHDISFVIIRGNRLSHCGGPARAGGVYIAQTRGNGIQRMRDITVVDNDISDCRYGISMSSSVPTKGQARITIRENRIRNSEQNGILVSDIYEFARIEENEIVQSGRDSVLLQTLNDSTISVVGNSLTRANGDRCGSISVPSTMPAERISITRNRLCA